MMKIKMMLARLGLLVLLAGCMPPAAVTPTLTTPEAAVAVVEATATLEPGVPLPTPTPTETVAPSPSAPERPASAIALLPAGSGIDITRIHMFSLGTGWGIGAPGGTGGQVANGEHVFKTLDGGNTWRDVTPPEPAPPAAEQRSVVAYFLDSETAWVTYFTSNGPPAVLRSTVWRTLDGGATWTESSELDVTELNEFYTPSHLVFAGPETGWLLAHVGVGMNHDYVALYKTSDGGQTWTRLIDPYTDSNIQSCAKTDLLFVTTGLGWLTGDCNGVAPGVLLFKTTDGGATWNTIDLPPPDSAPDIFNPDFVAACGAYTPVFFDALNGRLVVRCLRYDQDPPLSQNYLYTTSDGGASWTATDYPGGDLYMAPGGAGLALGEQIFTTGDGGQTWTQTGQVTWEGDFFFLSEQLGWAVARDGEQIALVQTGDGAQSWQVLHPLVVGP